MNRGGRSGAQGWQVWRLEVAGLALRGGRSSGQRWQVWRLEVAGLAARGGRGRLHTWGSERYAHSTSYAPACKNTLKQVDYAKIANIGLRGVGVVAHHGTDVVTRNAGGHFRAELLVDMVNAYLP